MNPGRFDRQIIFRSLSNGRNSSGDVVPTWTTYCTMWANVKPAQGNEIVTAGKQQAEASIIFTIRYRTDLTEDMDISYNGLFYNITGIQEITRKQYLQVAARAAKQ